MLIAVVATATHVSVIEKKKTIVILKYIPKKKASTTYDGLHLRSCKLRAKSYGGVERRVNAKATHG